MNPELRVGLLVDSLQLPAWIRHVIAEIQASGFARVTLVVQKDGPPRPPEALYQRAWRHRRRLAYLAYKWIDSRLFRTTNDAFAMGDASRLVADAERMFVAVRETRFCDYVRESDVERVRDARPDVLLRFGFRILKGSILHAARHGVWSYHHGDNHVNRGGPAGFWEVMEERPVTGSVLQVLNEDLDNGRVIYRSYAKTDRTSVWRNRNSYYWKSAAFVTRRLRDLAEDPASLTTGSGCDDLQVYSERLHRKPDNLEMCALVGRYLTRRAAERIQRIYRMDQWAIAFRRSDEPVPHSTLFRFTEHLPPQGTSWADPFPVEDGEDYHVFLEEYDHATRAGHISVARVTRDGAFEPPVTVVERPGHLSYPFVFQWRGKWFMMPESASASRVEILSASKFPYEWTPEDVLFEGVRAVDSTLVMVDDRWWLFTSMAAHSATRHDDELHAFHGPTPFGPWTPHRRNPVKSDVRSARGAGRFFRKDNRLFRPAQDGSGRYGSATTVNRIDRLTPADFHETIVTRFEPRWRSGLTGTHTLNSCAGLTTIDFRHARAKYLS
jgi:hypothetical protein